VAEAQGVPLLAPLFDTVGELEGAEEALREGAAEPEGSTEVEGLALGDASAVRDAVGSGEREGVAVVVAEAPPVFVAGPPVRDGAGEVEEVREPVCDADAERKGESEPEAQADAEGLTVELAVAHTVVQPEREREGVPEGQPLEVAASLGDGEGSAVGVPEASTLSVAENVGAADTEDVPEVDAVSEKESVASAVRVAPPPGDCVAPVGGEGVAPTGPLAGLAGAAATRHRLEQCGA